MTYKIYNKRLVFIMSLTKDANITRYFFLFQCECNMCFHIKTESIKIYQPSYWKYEHCKYSMVMHSSSDHIYLGSF